MKRRQPAGSLKRAHAVKKRAAQWMVFIIFTILFIVFVIGDHGVYQLYKIRKEKAEIQAKITRLRGQKILHEKEINKLETDIDYIEKLAREKYRMAKKGEKVFKVLEKNAG